MRGGIAILALCVGCDAPLLLDLSGRSDAVELVAIMDGEALEAVHGPVRLREGVRVSGEPFDIALAPGEVPYLVEIPLEAASHPLGPVDLDAIGLVSDPERAAIAEGSRLLLQRALPSAASVFRVDGDGLRSVGPGALDVRWTRTVETEPGTSPLERLTPAFPETPYPFMGRGPESELDGVRFMIDLGEGREVLVGGNRIMLVRDGRFPTLAATATRTADMRANPDTLYFSGWIDARPEHGVLLAGMEDARGVVFRVDADPERLILERVAYVGTSRLLGFGRTSDSMFWAANGEGEVFVASDPTGPWSDRSPPLGPGYPTRLEVSGSEVALAHSGNLMVWRDERWVELMPPGMALPTDIRALHWGSDGALWFGTTEGQLGRWDGSELILSRPRYPARMGVCVQSDVPLDAIETFVNITSLTEIDGKLLVMQDRCSAIYGFGLEDENSFLVMVGSPQPEVVVESNRSIFEHRGRWFVSQKGGRLMVGERR